ncbi:ABC transporter ATP-binding protein [Chelativorans sp. Marseille-P2723]|uniref:ABC transporter ATP-binding protein n=1 Tax=Chelativorans sp. Marseille-P2723 TaxID=2709133 RepID=UPI00157083BE|nr:ABC transporter ATP-binding protein [Chelativorans sp. Marseille-P2723]
MAERGARLTLSGVEKQYGKVVALHPTDLEIEPGEFFSLIGPSGSGKTTLLGTVAGFTPPTRGRISVDGTDVVAVPPYKRNIGMVFQNYALFPHMNVFENVAFPLRLRKLPADVVRERVESMLQSVRLPHVGNRMPSQLSGGQQQRIALARAAVYGPRMLLMDEPLGALDKNLREEMQLEIKAFHGQVDATVLYVTHDQDEAATMSDRLAIMNNGRIVQHGTPRELYEHPRNAFVACFLGRANLFRPIDGVESTAGGYRLSVKDDVILNAVSARTGAFTEREAVICVRPEAIRLESPDFKGDGNGTNVLRGTVIDAVYTAGTLRYQVDAGTGSPVSVWLPSVRQSEMLAAGEPVTLAWPANATLLIPEE